MTMRANAIFEGGGVKALGMLGALYEAEKKGYTWVNVAGTSAGAIVASLVAAGYSADEIRGMVWDIDFGLFKDKSWLSRIPYVGPALGLWFENGIFKGDYLEAWIHKKLEEKGIYTFKDLVSEDAAGDPVCRYKLVIIASDVSRRKLLRLPYDLKDYNLKPDDLDVSKAVRMSASLPFFYAPSKLLYNDQKNQKRFSYIIDGGVLSNFPVWIFDGDGTPSRPTFGFKIVEPEEINPSHIKNPFSLLIGILSTMMEAHDKLHELDPKSRVRTISIPSLGVKTTDFDTIHQQKDQLFLSGIQAASRFFDGWDFDLFKLHYFTENGNSTPYKIKLA